ncbi:MAG: chloride channel protein [Nitrososphaerota archaeon]|nr:chloride channel protein [Nitrososphaerota archaeon]MDG6950436.1 chloride channel protein [Nitrososphaerota archaeon]
MSGSTLMSRVNRVIQQGYLAKWVVVGLLIGVIAGAGAVGFYIAIEAVNNSLLGGITGFFPPNPAGEGAAPISVHPDYLLIPVATVIGGLVSGILVYRFAPEAEGHGTDEAIAAFHRRDGKIRRRIPLVKAAASAFTIGSGGSGGREGPTAQIAAGFGSFIGDFLKLPVKDRRIAVAVGIGAGIGSIFKSPFAGAILSGEILYSGGDFEVEALIPSFIASPIGYIIFASYTGFTPVFGSGLTYAFTEPRNLLIYAALGIVCGLVGRLHTVTFYSVKGLFARLPFTKYLRPMAGAAVAGVIGIFFPQVVGLGYGFVQILINSNGVGGLAQENFTNLAIPLFVFLVAVVFLKIVATAFTVGSGGSAGVFAPSLVIGGFVGAAFWMAVNFLLPGWIPIPAPLVVVGMMALFGGVGRVPIAVMLMVSEMTGSLNLLAPSMVAVVAAYFVTTPKYTIYKSQVPKRSDSPAHRGEYNVPLLTKIFVSDAMNRSVIALSPGDSVAAAYQVVVEKGYRGIPIVDGEKLIGIVTVSDLLRIPREKMDTTPLRDVMTQNVLVAHLDDTLFVALETMTNQGIGRLPVISKDSGRLVGIITRTDIIRAYERSIDLLSKAEPT